jgi:hypothetical protein
MGSPINPFYRAATTATAVTTLSASAFDRGTTIISWLQLVQENAISASQECLEQIADLSKVAPLPGSLDSSVKEVIDRVNAVAASKRYDPSLANKATLACRCLLYANTNSSRA